jgi:hypothetical protein
VVHAGALVVLFPSAEGDADAVGLAAPEGVTVVSTPLFSTETKGATELTDVVAVEVVGVGVLEVEVASNHLSVAVSRGN